MRLWLRFALRDLRSGLQGFWIFLACLALGVAAIAVVGSLAAAIERGLAEEGQPLLGGDLEFALIHRQASASEFAFIAAQGEAGRLATMRGMAVAGPETALVEIKAVDGTYPLYGALETDAAAGLGELLAERNGHFGAVVDPLLLGRLGIAIGGRIKIGDIELEVRAAIAREPDRISDGLIFGPRVLIGQAALAATGLIEPGSLITWRYRVKLAGAAELGRARAIAAEAKRRFPDAGWRVRTRDQAASGADRFIERLGFFMTLVGLTALIVGGAGIANAVTAFVDRKTGTIATLKCLGAPARLVFGIYLTEIVLVSLIGIALGLAAGAVAPWLAHRALSDILPLPLLPSVEPLPLACAAAFGLLVTLAFAIWPLARSRGVPASALFRHRIAAAGGRPGLPDLLAIAAALGLMAALAYASFEDWRITSYYLGGLAASFVVLSGLAWAIVRLTRVLPRPTSAIWRYATSSLSRPGSAAASVILALGLGLTLFVTLALTDRTISRELLSGIPERAPAFFFLDVRNQDRDAFIARLKSEPGVRAVETAPMLRGRIVKVGDIPADKVRADPDAAWALRGDRGLTYAETLPAGSTLKTGEWWPKDYAGPPLVSLVDEIAEGIGLAIGDSVTVNVLGRDIEARVANLRAVNWRSLDINFVMVFSPNTLRAAPHNHLVTIEMEGGDEARLVNEMARAYPAVTAIRVKEAIAAVSDLLAKMLAAIRGANVLTLLTGILVLAGALAAGLSERIHDAVVLKTYGATRRQLMLAFVAEYAVLGLAAAAFGIAAGSLASYFLAFWVLEMPWSFSAPTAVATALIAMAVTVSAGLLATWRALTVKPAPILREE